MVKENLDTLFEPIEFTLNGTDHKIEAVSQELMEKVLAVDMADQGNGVIKQFSILTGISEEDAKKFDFRKIRRVIELVMNTMKAEGSVKNE